MQTDAIILLPVVKTADLKTCIDEVLKSLLDDLKKLASDDGYYFTVGNSTIPLRGAVSVFFGDTPASQLAGGFKEGVAFTMKCCRHCETSKDDMQNIFGESQCVLRSEACLESQNERIDSFPALA